MGKKAYWGKQEEDAVAEYLSLPRNSKESEMVYIKKLYKPMRKLVESIMFVYHLNITNEDVNDQIDDCLGFVVLKMDKYKPERPTRAFSYYGTVAKNYMIARKNKNYKKKIKTIDIEDTNGFEMEQNLYIDNEYDEDMKSLTFLINMTIEDINFVLSNDINMDANTYKLGEAITTLLKNYQHISITHKRQFYFIAKEFTGLTTKEITKSLKIIKEIFAYSNEKFTQ